MIVGYFEPLENFDKEKREQIAKEKANTYIAMGASNFYDPTADDSLDELSMQSFGGRARFKRQYVCRRLWNSQMDFRSFDYLRDKREKKELDKNLSIEKIITMELPAKIRAYQIVRPRLAALISKEKNRPLTPKVYALDTDTVEERKKRHIDTVLKKEHEKHLARLSAQSLLKEAIQVQEQTAQALQEQAKQNPAVAQQLQQQMQDLAQQITQLRAQAQAEAKLSEDELKEINHYFEHRYKDTKELLCEKALQYNINYHRYKDIFNMGFTNKMIHDEELYSVWWEPGMSDIEMRVVHPENFWYQPSEMARYVDEVDWCVERQRMTHAQIVNRYGNVLKTHQVDQLRQQFANMGGGSNTGSIFSAYDPDGYPMGGYHSHLANSSLTLDVFRVFWKEDVTMYALLEKVEDRAEPVFLRWLEKEEHGKFKPKKGQLVEPRYRTDLWQAERIGYTDIWMNVGKCAYQPRTSTAISQVALPYVGRAINYFHQPNSLIWATKDLQEMYNILCFQQELLVVLSGVKGTVYDLSQAPDGMEPSEVMHMMKRGLLFIESMKNGHSVPFNQFSQYDQTLSPAIGIIEEMKRAIVQMVGAITGINDQQVGQQSTRDLVGTSQMALDQSNVVVENYFQQHEELVERVHSKVVGLIPYAYASGKQGSYILGADKQEMLSIPEGALEEGEFAAIVRNGGKERKAMDTMEQVLQMRMTQNQIPASTYLEILNLDTVHEMLHALQDAEKNMQQLAQGAEQQKQQAAMQIEQMRGQLEMQMKQFEASIKDSELQLKAQLEQQKLALQQQDLQLQQQAEAAKVDADRYAVDVDASVEQAYLGFQYDQMAVNAKHQELALKLQQQKEALSFIKKPTSKSDGGSKERIKD